MPTCRNLFALSAATAAVFLAACEPATDPAGPAPVTVTAAAEPLAIEADMFFALEVLDIPTTDVTDVARAVVINNAGQVAGSLRAADGARDSDFRFDLGTGQYFEISKNSTDPYLYGVSMNGLGLVVATTACVSGDGCETRPYRWNGGAVEVLTGGDYRSVANSVNDAGTVVGYSGPAFDPWRAAKWLPDGTYEALDLGGIITSANYSRALGVNNAGVIVGDAEVDGVGVPLLWNPDGNVARLTDLEAAIAAVAPGTVENVTPFDINDHGDMFGWWSSTGADVRNPFVWTAEGTLIDFNSVGDFGDMIGGAMNELGEVAFTIVDGPFDDLRFTPWFWNEAAGFIALPTLDQQTAAADLNDDGLIVGNGTSVAVLWRPLSSAGEGLDELEDTLDDVLAGGSVDVEGGTGLEAKLRQIRAHLESGRANAARNQLDAFVNQVEAMIADGRIAAGDGARLLAAAATLAALLA